MDATSTSALPHGVSDTRVPQWMLPSLPPDTLALLRPDILLIEGLTVAHFHAIQASLYSPTVLSSLQARCLIHILELGYTSDICRADSLTRKRCQHSALTMHLQAAGWKIHSNSSSQQRPPRLHTPLIPPSPIPFLSLPPTTCSPFVPPVPFDLSQFVHIVLLGTSGIIYSPIPAILATLGIPPFLITSLLNSLHVHAVQTAQSIICLRRRLENLPSAFHSHVSPPLFDPP